MGQNNALTYTKLPKKLVARLKTGAQTGTFVPGETITGGTSGATATVKKKFSATELWVNNVSAALFADAETITGGTSGATAAVATNGYDISATTSGWVRTQRIGSRVLTEVLAAISGLSTKRTDFLTVPTYGTGVMSYTTDNTLVTGEIATLTLTASEAVQVIGLPSVALTINGTVRQMVFDPATSTGTSLKFKYTAVAGDVATAGQVSIAASVTMNGGQFADISGDGTFPQASVTFVAPDVSAVTFN